MLTELCLTVALALFGGQCARWLGAPGLLGMMGVGMLLGASGLDLIGTELRSVLAEFKTVALVGILLRAGLGIDRSTLQQIGGPALRMGFIPGFCEGAVVAVCGHLLLDLAWYEAGMLGFLLAAVSPAVIVPQMLELKETGLGRARQVPTLILAGASLDDVFAIVAFGVCAGLAGGTTQHVWQLAIAVPGGVFLGGAIGLGLGLLLAAVLLRVEMRATVRSLSVLMTALVFYELSELPALKQYLSIASLLGIMAIGFALREAQTALARNVAGQLNEVWVVAEVLLFVYIGAAVDLSQLEGALLPVGLGILSLGLLARSAGVAASLARSALTRRERLFSMLAYTPKATVQAAMGAVPLSLVQAGKLGATTEATAQRLLAMAVLSIVVTAPLGALAIRWAAPRMLEE